MPNRPITQYVAMICTNCISSSIARTSVFSCCFCVFSALISALFSCLSCDWTLLFTHAMQESFQASTTSNRARTGGWVWTSWEAEVMNVLIITIVIHTAVKRTYHQWTELGAERHLSRIHQSVFWSKSRAYKPLHQLVTNPRCPASVSNQEPSTNNTYVDTNSWMLRSKCYVGERGAAVPHARLVSK